MTATKHRFSFLAFLGVLAAPASAADPAKLVLSPCAVAGVAEPARCGTYEVFENRETRQGRKIPLKVVVLPATGPDRRPEPLVFFAGGPGEGAVGSAAGVAEGLVRVRREHDVVLVDVRGTGDSQALVCESMMGATGAQKFLDDFLPREAIEACREQWRAVDLTRYTTAEIVDDVAEVLTALGYERANLLGGSYGTRAAQVFAARHPSRVRTMLLEGVVAMDERMPISVARDAQRALDGWIAECAGDAACHAAFPRFAEEFASVLERVRKAPVEVQVFDARSGKRVPIRLSDKGFGQTVRYMLYVPALALALPLYVHLAAEGDFGPLAETAYFFATALSGANFADGLYLSVLCAEDVAFIEPAEVAAAVAGTFLGDFRISRQRDACAAWPARKLSREVLTPIRSEVPTLLVSGERDPVTPAASGEAVARGFRNSLHLVLPDGAHGQDGLVGAQECLDDLTARFLAAGSVTGLDTSCLGKIARAPFLLAVERPSGATPPAAELERFVGRYAGFGEAPTPVFLVDGQLKLTGPNGQDYFLLAITATRFAIAGAPAGYVVEFRLGAEGKVTGAVVEQGPGRRVELTKQ